VELRVVLRADDGRLLRPRDRERADVEQEAQVALAQLRLLRVGHGFGPHAERDDTLVGPSWHAVHAGERDALRGRDDGVELRDGGGADTREVPDVGHAQEREIVCFGE
jgi:hypothetical protein